MKKIYILLALFLSLGVFAQAPEGFNYQATVRNNVGTLITNQSVAFKFSVLQNSMTGTAVYAETQTTTTDDLGAVSLKVGQGTATTGTFSTINWGNGTYYLKIELNTGSGFVAMGTTQLLSVPYALYAKSSGTSQNMGVATIFITGNITDAQAAAQIAAEAGPLTQKIRIENTTGLTTVDLSMFKNLEYLGISQNSNLTSVNLNGLTKVFGEIYVSGNTALTSINLNGFTTISDALYISNNPVLTSVSFPMLSYAGGDLNLSSNALGTTQVNTILHQLLNKKPSTGGYVNLSNQNPVAPPTGQGLTDLTTLTANGGNITVDTPSTSLKLTIKDNNGNIVSGATVTLYTDINFTQQIGTMTSDANGIVLFNNLTSQIYYFDASKTQGCLNNNVAFTPSSASTFTAIAIGMTTSINVTVVPSGSITFANNDTTASYNLYIASTPSAYNLLGTMPPSFSAPLKIKPGTYDIKYVKLDSNNQETSTVVIKSGKAVTTCATVAVSVP